MLIGGWQEKFEKGCSNNADVYIGKSTWSWTQGLEKTEYSGSSIKTCEMNKSLNIRMEKSNLIGLKKCSGTAPALTFPVHQHSARAASWTEHPLWPGPHYIDVPSTVNHPEQNSWHLPTLNSFPLGRGGKVKLATHARTHAYTQAGTHLSVKSNM